ncbi:hypothetical protein Mal64_05310 [Pseudobythopirellula maris]|uniref:Prepilin-type N-terminal cleavage/methylation domain-containing protein n=1 Tax=Pseudobythopirellula maris TaxID=2527991 RepID=A0A5C5ZT16_9BACT|nr:prepilin-type N-terminal cleavage/methylation domain-containing protein [Pseudobythopirellula maris]TWT90147.1 hypothetical protein Mal64_05310 [Pseudobythopirellula maris]
MSRHALLRNSPKGFTLLEVILAIALLAVSLAALGEVVRHSHLSAERAVDLSEATLIAESLVEAMKAGVQPLSAVQGVAWQPADAEGDFGGAADWVYSVEFGETGFDGLTAVKVRVEPAITYGANPGGPTGRGAVELVRWFSDPQFLDPDGVAASGGANAASSSGDSSSTGGL